MMPTVVNDQAPVPPPACHRAQARLGASLHIDALTLVTTLHLLALCRLAIGVAHCRCPPPLPAGPGGTPRSYSEESLLLIALLRTLWRLSYHDMHDWLRDWPALALACGLPLARPLLAWAVHLYHIRPRIIRLDAGYWGLCLIAWIHSALGAVAVVPWNRHSPEEPLLLTSDLEAREELGKRSAIERFFGRVFLFFHLQRPSLCGWSAIARQVALTYTATILDSIVCDHYKGHFLTNPLCNFCVK